MKKFNSCTKLFLVLALFLTSILKISAQDEDVMFQAFDWNVQNQPAGQTWYDVVTQVRPVIVDAGLDVLWMPPPSNSAAPQGYLPRELYNFDSAYGTERQLRNLISQYHNDGLKILSDIVINHRVGSNDAVTFTNPAWPTYFITADDEGRQFVDFPVEFSINGDFVPGRSLKADGSNGTYGPARDLDHKNPEVRGEITKWMNFLKNDLGFDGWRYDFVHGYDPIYNKEYNDATQPYFAVGELLESSRVQTNNFVNATQQSSSAFDFNTKVSLQNAIRDNNFSYLRDFQGRPSGMMGLNPSKSVTFLDNHDTGFAQQCCGSGYVFPSDQNSLRKGYAYILTHPGNPMVFWTHFFDGGADVRTAIKDLIAIRKSVRVASGSRIVIDQARRDLYAAYIDGKSGTLAMKLGSGNWSPNGAGWTIRTAGTDYAVWTKGGSTATPDPGPAPAPVSFKVYVKDFQSIYTWNDNGQPTSGRWPGKPTVSENGWQTASIIGECSNIIFSNNGRNKTPDLRTCKDKPYYYRGEWFAEDPTITSSNTTDLTVFVQGFSTIYTWTGRTATSGRWPGAGMEALGNNWYRYTLANTECSNIVFSNNGSGQTRNLSTCRDTPYFYNNRWNANPPAGRKVANVSNQDITTVIVAPNPISATSKIQFQLEATQNVQVVVSNILGQQETLFQSKLGTGSHTIELADSKLLQATGIYFINTIIDGSSNLQKVSIQ